jgi:hypothetical protein
VLDDQAADLEVGEHLQGIDTGRRGPARGLHQSAHLFHQRTQTAGRVTPSWSAWSGFGFLLHHRGNST